MGRNAIAFFSDTVMLPGLHAALTSLAHSNPKLDADIFVFCENLNFRDKRGIQATWLLTGHGAVIHLIDFEPMSLGRSLHGSMVTYGRICLASLLPLHDKAIYLDCDIIVKANLGALLGLLTEDTPLLADCSGIIRNALDRDFFTSEGISINDNYFNSGVLALNLVVWRSQDLVERCLQFARLRGSELVSHDQTLLNFLFHDTVGNFPSKYNIQCHPDFDSNSILLDGVYHFAGLPKPWDLGSRWLHGSFWLWNYYYSQSSDASRFCRLAFGSRKRFLSVFKSALYLFAKRLKSWLRSSLRT